MTRRHWALRGIARAQLGDFALALLGDAEKRSSSALALGLGASQRTVHCASDERLAVDKVPVVGNARARRWMAPDPDKLVTPGHAA